MKGIICTIYYLPLATIKYVLYLSCWWRSVSRESMRVLSQVKSYSWAQLLIISLHDVMAKDCQILRYIWKGDPINTDLQGEYYLMVTVSLDARVIAHKKQSSIHTFTVGGDTTQMWVLSVLSTVTRFIWFYDFCLRFLPKKQVLCVTWGHTHICQQGFAHCKNPFLQGER